jgi:nitrate reductase cytochrome c-type subunit
MKKYIILPVAFLMLLLVSCNDSKKTNYTNQTDIKVEAIMYTASNHPGKILMENKCYVCHNPSTDHDGRIAPPMVAVKSHYMTDDITKEEFANAIWHFVEKPTKEKSKMRGAVRRFNLMPYQPFEEKDIKQIADYIYDYKIDEPEWFKEHIEEESKGKVQYRNDGKDVVGTDNGDNGTAYAKAESKTHTEIGMEYALNMKKELGKNLMGTIQKKGTLEAVKFCNKQAYPITDSMAVAQNASIRRVSDKPRNVENQANAKELEIIKKFKKAIANNEKYEPVTEIEDGTVKFYAPITTNSMCLQCHGSPNKNIEPSVFAAITSLYPEDKATGYGVNEVRGIWSITYKQ